MLLSLAIAVFAGGMIIGVPVAFALGFASVVYVLLSNESIVILPTLIFGGMDSFPLLGIPFFILAGDLLSRSGMLQKMISFSQAIMGPLRGGLAQVNVGSSMLFGGVTGVSVADAAAVGRTLIPAMVDSGYRRGFAAALTACSSVMGAIIPPSVSMLIVAYLYGGQISIGKLFLAGAVPGLLIGLAMMSLVAFMARRQNLPRGSEGWSLHHIANEAVGAALGLVVPVVVIGGIVGGIFTATEAGAIAVAYALLIGLATRSLSTRDIYDALLLSAKTSGLVFILLAAAKVFAWVLTINLFSIHVSEFIQSYISSPTLFLLVAITIFLLLGFVLEGVASMIMLLPVLVPLAKIYGIEPHHFALLVVMTIQIALVTPPVALGLFIVSPFAGCTVKDAATEALPFIGAILAIILLTLFVPQVAMWLPRQFGYP